MAPFSPNPFFCYTYSMQVVLIILSVGLLGVIIYFAVSHKSSRLLRLTALIALGLIGVSLAVCGFFIIRGPGEDEADIILPIFQEAQPQKQSSNIPATLGFFAVFFLVMGLIVFVSLRRQSKKDKSGKKAPVKAAAFKDESELRLDDSAGIEIDDSFDIDIE